MKRFLISIVSLLCYLTLSAQSSLKVESFTLDPTDLTAQQRNVKDVNGDICALIKVQVVDKEVTFEGDIISQNQQQKNEYYVFSIDGTQRIKVLPSKALPLDVEFSDYGIDEVEGGKTYILRIVWTETAAGVSFKVGIPDVKITIDGQSYVTDELGDLDLPLADGVYSYSVEKENYVTVYDTLTIDRLPAVVNVNLQTDSRLKDKGVLLFTYPLNAEFTVTPASKNAAKPIKKKIKTGEALALNGDYLVSFKKKRYITEVMSVTVKQGQVVSKRFDPGLEADRYFVSGNYQKAFKEYNKLAKADDDLGLFRLGVCYMEGKGVPTNSDAALSYWRRSAELGNINACVRLFENEPTKEKQIIWLEKAVQKGDMESLMKLVRIYKAEKQWERVKYWLDYAFKSGNPSAEIYYEMGELFYRGNRGIKQNFSRAYKYFSNAASLGNVIAKERLVDYVYLGLDGQNMDQLKAVKDYLKLEILSDDGNYKVGMYYYNTKNADSAHFYFSKISLEKILEVPYTGEAKEAFKNLGHSFWRNDDFGNAAFYYLMYETIGGAPNEDIYNRLGYVYRLGKGVLKNVSLGYNYYKKSSDMGNEEGICMLGLCYEKGEGVNKNLKEAVRLYQIAEKKGSATAAAYLGTMYYLGEGGLSKNRNMAIRLWTKAGNAEQPVLTAINNLINYYKAKRNTKQVNYWTNKKNKLAGF